MIKTTGDTPMKKDNTVSFPKGGTNRHQDSSGTLNQTDNNLPPKDALTDLLKVGAQRLLMEAVEAEVAEFLSRHSHLRDEAGRQHMVRNGTLPERTIQTGLGDIPIQVPRTRDRSGGGVTFSSHLLPPYLKRTKSIDELLPYLYLKGLSTGDFSEALASLLGPDAKGLSTTHLARLKEGWKADLKAFQKRDLSDKRYIYFWVDGVYLNARLEERQCMLVIIGADKTGKKELVALSGGFRESELSWKEVLVDLKSRGLETGPELAIGDGSLGFWKALPQVYGASRKQRCWVHKQANVLNKLPKKIQPMAKQALAEIWQGSDTKEDAEKAFDKFTQTYEDKYPKAVECLAKDKKVLLTFYDFPAAHWRSIRTTNPIESVFASVKQRTVKTKGCLSLESAEVMTFKLIASAQKRWKRLAKGELHMAEIIRGVPFKNGVAQKTPKMDNDHVEDARCAA